MESPVSLISMMSSPSNHTIPPKIIVTEMFRECLFEVGRMFTYYLMFPYISLKKVCNVSAAFTETQTNNLEQRHFR